MAHSPGPWELVEGSNESGAVYIRTSDGHELYIGDMEDTCVTCHKNGQLAAAAPDLLDVIERIICVSPDLHPQLIARARAAIAKAYGVKP